MSVKVDKIIIIPASEPTPAPTQDTGTSTSGTFEAEAFTPAATGATGTKDCSGIVGMPSDAKGVILSGTKKSLSAGNYKVYVFAKLQDNTCVGTDTEILSFDGISPSYSITGKAFTKKNTYYAVPIPVTVAGDTELELKFTYYPASGATIKIDKVMVADENAAAPTVTQDFTQMTFEAEKANRSTGYPDANGMIGTPQFASNHLIWGNDTILMPGNYKLVVYAKLLDENGVDKDTTILFFDGTNQAQYAYTITGKSFPKANTYYAIEVPLKTQKDAVKTEIRFQYKAESGASVKIDKTILMYANDPTPEPEQIADVDPAVPADVTPVDFKSYTIAPDTIPIRNDSAQFPTASIVSGSIHFSTQINTAGGTDTSKEILYFNNGDKVMRFYVRLHEKAPGNVALLKLYLMRYNGDSKLFEPVTVYSVSSGSFREASYNDIVKIDIPFTAKSCYGYTFKIDYTAKASLTIDRVEVTDAGAPAYTGQDIAVQGAEKNGVYTVQITEDTAQSMSAFDTVAISHGNVTYRLSYAVMNAYVLSGGKLEVAISDIESADRSAMDSATKLSRIMLKGYDAYKVQVTAYDAGGKQVIYTPNKGNTISIKADDATMSDNAADNMYGMIFDKDQNTITPSVQKLNTESKTVTYSAPGSNIYMIGAGTPAFIASLTSQYAKDFPGKQLPPDYSGDKENNTGNPITGNGMSAAIFLIAVSAVAVVYGTKKLKASKK